MKKTALPALLFVMTALVVALMAGCSGGGNDAIAPDRIVKVIIPSVGGVVANRIWGDHFLGPNTKYGFSVQSAVLPKGSPTTPPDEYPVTVSVWQVPSDSATQDDAIRAVVRDPAGLHDLSLSGYYYARAVQQDSPYSGYSVAECWIQTGPYPLGE